MPHFYRDSTGDFDVEATEASLTVTNSGAEVSRIDFSGDDWPMFCRVHTDGRVLYKSHQDGAAMLFKDGIVTRLHELVTEGNWPCAWGPDGSIHLRLRSGPSQGQYHIIDPHGVGRVVANQRVEEASTGFHHIAADGSPVVLHDPALHRLPSGGNPELWWLDIDADGTIVALSDGGGPAGCVVRIAPNGTIDMWVPETDLPHPPFITNGRVAISGQNTPAPTAVPWVPHVPRVEAPPESLPAIVLKELRPRWVVDTSGVLSGNGISTVAHNEPALFEDALWVDAADEPRLQALYFGPETPRTGTREEYYQTTVAMAQRNRVPVFVNDEFGAESGSWRERLRTDGCRVIDGLELYRAVSESREAFKTRTRSRLTAAERPYGTVRPFYDPQGGGSALECAWTNLIIDECLAEQPDAPVLEDAFGLDRPPLSPWRKDYLGQLIAQTPQPASLREAAPVPVPPPVKPTPPVTPPPPPFWWGVPTIPDSEIERRRKEREAMGRQD